MEEEMLKKKKPIGIAIMGWLYSIFGSWKILSLIFLIFYLIKTGRIYGYPELPANLFLTLRDYIVNMVLPIAFLISGIGVLQLKNWARILFIIVTGIGLITTLHVLFLSTKLTNLGAYPFYGSERANLFNIGFTFMLFVIPIYYLTRPKVKEQFR
jgi:hypothetical protein